MRGREDDVEYVAGLLACVEVRSERESGFVGVDDRDRPSSLADGESEGETTNSENMEDEFALEELEDFTEEQATFVFALVENRMPRHRRTWKENKDFKGSVVSCRRRAQNSCQLARQTKPRAGSTHT